MQRIRITALCAALAVLLSGCSFPYSLLDHLVEDVYDAHKYVSVFSDFPRYNKLSSTEKEYYGCLYTAVTDTASTESAITIRSQQNAEMPGVRVVIPQTGLTNDQASAVFEAFFNDNPQFFFLDRTYNIEGKQMQDGSTRYNTLILQYTMSATERIQAAAQMEAVVANILADCPERSDDYLVELYLHDQLTQRCSYDEEASQDSSNSDPNAYTAFGALVEGSAVCEGYAKALQLLLREVDIPVDLVTGTAIENGESHMWNLVTINDATYHLDATWNDSGDRNQHTFFNITTEQLQKSFVLDEGQNLPLCTDTADNYFVKQGTVIDTYERQTIAKIIAKRILAGDTTIQLQFNESKYDNGLLFLKNQKLMTSMVNSHLEDSALKMWDYTLWSDTSQHVLTLIKEA